MQDWIGTLAIVVGVYLFAKITKKALKIVFTLIALFGIAMTLYGEQITALITNYLSNR